MRLCVCVCSCSETTILWRSHWNFINSSSKNYWIGTLAKYLFLFLVLGIYARNFNVPCRPLPTSALVSAFPLSAFRILLFDFFYDFSFSLHHFFTLLFICYFSDLIFSVRSFHFIVDVRFWLWSDFGNFLDYISKIFSSLFNKVVCNAGKSILLGKVVVSFIGTYFIYFN